MALEHTKNKYYGDWSQRKPNTITERKADSDVLARAKRAKSILRGNEVLGGLADKNYGAKKDTVKRKAAPVKPASKTKAKNNAGPASVITKAWQRQMDRNKTFTSNTERGHFGSQKPWKED